MNITKEFTRVPNQLLDALCGLDISGNEMRILLYIIRRTYGFNREYVEIPLSAAAAAVGMHSSHVSKALKKLVSLGIIERHAAKGIRPQTISVRREFAESLLQENVSVTENGNDTVAGNGNEDITVNGNAAVTHNGNRTYKEIKKDIKEREIKGLGHYGNVFLTDKQLRELTDDYGETNISDYIRKVDCHVQCTGRPYSDYEAVIRKWLEDDKVKKDDFDIRKYEVLINRF